MDLSVQLRRQIIHFFMSFPNIHDPNTPRALIQGANLDPQLLSQISFTGAPGQFFQLLLPTLLQYGKLRDGRPALQAVLEASRDFLGPDGVQACHHLIRELGWTPGEYTPPPEQSYTAAQGPTPANSSRHSVYNITIGNNARIESSNFADGGKIISNVKNTGHIVQADESEVGIAETSQQGMSTEDVLKLFEKMRRAVDDIEGVPRREKIEAKAEVEKAMAEIEEPEYGIEPDKETVAGYLKNATETLKTASATALEAASFGKLTAQAVEWLGEQYSWLLDLYSRA